MLPSSCPSNDMQPVPTFRLKLPQELVDGIIDELQHDITTLKACALTQRSMVYRSQYHIHREVLLDCTVSSDADRYTSPNISQFVRKLSLYTPYRSAFDMSEESSINEDAAALYAKEETHQRRPWTVISRLTGVRDLFLVDFSWNISQSDRDLFATQFQHITSLSLRLASFADSEDFLSFLSAFPGLKSLKLSGVSWIGPWGARKWIRYPSHSRPTPPGRNLQTLSLVGFAYGEVIEGISSWISSLVANGANGLTLVWSPNDGFQCLPDLLRGFGPSLSRFIVEMDCAKEILSFDDAPRRNTSLQTLSFCLTAPGLPRRSAGRYQWIPDFLSTVSSAQVATIEIRCDCQNPAQLERLFLQEIDEVLSKAKFSKLARIVLTVPNTLRSTEVQHVLKRVLPWITKQRLLEICYKPVDYEQSPNLESALALPC